MSEQFSITLKDKIVLLVAKRNSGKSYLLRHLVRRQKTLFDSIFVICPTEQINKFYSKDDFINSKNIMTDYNEEWVQNLIEKMTKINSGKDKNTKEFKRVLIILDDAVADSDLHHSDTFKILMIRSRHIGISLIFTSQYVNLIPPVSRNNSDYILLGQLNAKSLDVSAEEFSNNLSKKEFIEIYKEATTNYTFLAINQTSSKTGSLEEHYGTLKTPKEEFN